jgi:hypothetical protein
LHDNRELVVAGQFGRLGDSSKRRVCAVEMPPKVVISRCSLWWRREERRGDNLATTKNASEAAERQLNIALRARLSFSAPA